MAMHDFLDTDRWTVHIIEPPKPNTDSFARSLVDGFVLYDAKTATCFPRPYLLLDGRIKILGDVWNGSRLDNKTQRAVIWEATLS